MNDELLAAVYALLVEWNASLMAPWDTQGIRATRRKVAVLEALIGEEIRRRQTANAKEQP